MESRDITLTSQGIPTTIPSYSHDSGPMPWQRALETWKDTLDSATTSRNYCATITTLFSTPGMPAFIEHVSPTLLTAWRGSLVHRSQLPLGSDGRIASATVNRHLSAARAFFRFWQIAGRLGFSKDELFQALKLVKAKVERRYAVLKDSEIDAIIEATRATGAITAGAERIGRKAWARMYKGKDAPLADRDAVIIILALATGLRCDELHSLDIGNLSQDGPAWWIAVHGGKGNKDRAVPLSADDADVLLRYIASTGRKFARASDREQPLWLNRRGYRLSTSQIRRIIDAAADVATAQGGISAGKTISPHSLRHTYAVKLIKGDADAGRRPATLPEVQRVLGHENITTTQRYIEHINDDELTAIAPSISRAHVHRNIGNGATN